MRRLRTAAGSRLGEDLTDIPIRKAVATLALPMVLQPLLSALLMITDVFFVAKLGADEVAAVGFTYAATSLFYMPASGLGLAASAMIARHVGAKDGGAGAVAGQCLLLGLFLALIVSVPAAIARDDILRALGASESVLAAGGGYAGIVFAGSATILYLYLFNCIFRSAGDARVATNSLWVANGLNLLLMPLLIFGWGPCPALGIEGAAIAALASRAAGILYQIYHLAGGRGRVRLAAGDLRPRLADSLALLKLSWGGAVQALIFTGSSIFIIRIVAEFGPQAVAGYVIAIRIIMFALLPATGLASAAATLTGQYLGAGKDDMAEAAVWRVIGYNVVFMSAVGLLFFGAAGMLAGLFSRDPAVIRHVVDLLKIVSPTYLVYPAGLVILHALNGAGRIALSTKITFLFYWLVQLPLCYLLALETRLGLSGIWIAMAAAPLLMSLFAIVVFRRGGWKAPASSEAVLRSE